MVGHEEHFNRKVKYWRREFINEIDYEYQKKDMYAYKMKRRQSVLH